MLVREGSAFEERRALMADDKMRRWDIGEMTEERYHTFQITPATSLEDHDGITSDNSSSAAFKRPARFGTSEQ